MYIKQKVTEECFYWKVLELFYVFMVHSSHFFVCGEILLVYLIILIFTFSFVLYNKVLKEIKNAY